MEAQYKDGAQPMPAGLKKQVDTWRKTAQRYETEPETGEGRKELAARAKVKEAARDKAMSAYHMFEYGSAALQLAIVLAGAAALTTCGVADRSCRLAWGLIGRRVRRAGLPRADPDPPLTAPLAAPSRAPRPARTPAPPVARRRPDPGSPADGAPVCRKATPPRPGSLSP